MTSNISPISNQNKDLHNRLIILEKFIELKSNECAYYRSKVHLMQMNSVNSQIVNNKTSSKNYQRSSSEDISQNSIASHSQMNRIDHRHRRNSVPSPKKFPLKNSIPHLSNSSLPFASSNHRRYRSEKTYAQNQNYYEEAPANSPSVSKNQIEQILISYLNKHLPQS
jgi:hypothetical protein